MPQHRIFAAIGASPASAAKAANIPTPDSGFPNRDTQDIALEGSITNDGAPVVNVIYKVSDGITPTAGVGARVLISAPGVGGVRKVGSLTGTLSVVTDGAEVGNVELLPAYASASTGAGVRVSAPATNLVNGLDVILSASGSAVAIAPYGASTNTGLTAKAKGTGPFVIAKPDGTAVLTVTSTGGMTLARTTDTSGTPTVTAPTAIVRVPNGSATLSVTCTAVTATTLILGTIRNSTSNAVYLKNIIPGAGSFTVTLSGDPGASNADIAIFIFN